MSDPLNRFDKIKADPKSHQYGEQYHKLNLPHLVEASTSSRTSSPLHMISPALTWSSRMQNSPGSSFRQLRATATLSGDGSNLARIYEQFPGVKQSYISELMRLYSNRENLVISALLSEGHERKHFIIDEALFYKLKGHFPEIDGELIRKILIKNNNHKYDSIKEICSNLGLFNTASYKYNGPNSPQLKLKYLVLNYDGTDANYLLDMLDNNENDVQKVTEMLASFGYKQNDEIHMVTKISETAVREAKAKLAVPRPSTLSIRRGRHKTVQEQEEVRRIMLTEFGDHDIVLINQALEATGFDVDLSRQLLATMTPHNSPKYLVRTLLDEKEAKEGKCLVTRFVQTRSTLQDLMGVPARQVAGVEVAETCDKSTSTKEDGIIIPKGHRPLASGPNPENHHGPSCQRVCERVEVCPKIAPLKQGVAPKREPRSWTPHKSLAQGSRQEFGQLRITEHLVRLKKQQVDDEDDW